MKRFKLYCLPYAGSSGYTYLSWNKYLSDDIELVPYELPGRGHRFDYRPFHSIDEAADDICSFIANDYQEHEYGIYGHSMGALLAFEAYHKLVKAGIKLPFHMFFSGRCSPETSHNDTKKYLLSDEEFLNAVYEYGGNTKEAFQSEILYNLYLPILRADFKMIEEYRYEEKTQKISTDISVFYGSEDKSTPCTKVESWSNFAALNCVIHKYRGGHFFIDENKSSIIDIINQIYRKHQN